MSPEEYKSLRSQGKLAHQQRSATVHRTAEEQRESVRAKRTEHLAKVDHDRNVRALARDELDRQRAATINTPESILKLQIQRRDELQRQGRTDSARYYSSLIAKTQATVDAQNALKDFHKSDEYQSVLEVSTPVRVLVAKYTPESLAQYDSALLVYETTQDKDKLFADLAKLSTKATLVEQAARREQQTQLAAQQTLLSQANDEMLATSKANDAIIAAAAQLKAAE